MPTLAENKRTMHKYTVIESWDAGIVLSGPEVKSAKTGRVDLSGSYATFEKNELWLVNCHIAPYAPAKGAQRDYDPRRRRKLLLTRKELDSLFGKAASNVFSLELASVITVLGIYGIVFIGHLSSSD